MRGARRAAPPRAAARARVLAALLALGVAAAAHPPLVLNYHRVETPARVTFAPSAALLVDQVRRLQALGYRFVTASELARALAAPDALTAPDALGVPDARASASLAAVTFDDGDASVLHALPVLAALGVPATVFVIGDRIGTPGALSADDLRTLVAAGWEVGSHGARHARLTELSPEGLARDLDDAVAAIVAAIGVAPACLAYPYGLHDARVRAAAAARHACAFTTGPGHPRPGDDPLALPRPPSSPLDAVDLGWRTDADGSALALALATAAAGWAVAPPAATHPPRVGWSPTAWRALGDGAFELDVHAGTATQAFAVREGAWALHALQARGTRPAAALALARALPGATMALAWTAHDGWGVGAAADLGGRGEAWAWWSGASGWRVGATLILGDGVQARAAWRPAAGALEAEARAALPLWPEEGRPLALLVGVRGEGGAPTPHVGAAFRLGAHEGALRLDARGRFGAALAVRW